MRNYIILRNGVKEHYFSNQSGCIYLRSFKNGFWTSPQMIECPCTGDFGLFIDERENVHIVSSDKQNDIKYTLIRDDDITHHIILAGKPDVVPSHFAVTSQNGFLNLFYIVSANSEQLLVHCILGNNSRPSVICKVSSPEFFIFGHLVYFSNENSVLGYCDFHDGKPDTFIPVRENSSSPYLCSFGGQSQLVCKCGNTVMLDDKEIISANDICSPILVNTGAAVDIMWQSGGSIQYISADKAIKENETASPMRFISSGKYPELFCVQSGHTISYFYGTHSSGELNIFGTSDIFPTNTNSSHHQNTNQASSDNDIDVRRIKAILDVTRCEINEIKKQLFAIRKIIEEISSHDII